MPSNAGPVVMVLQSLSPSLSTSETQIDMQQFFCCFEEELDTGFMVKSMLEFEEVDVFQKVVFYLITSACFQWILKDDILSRSF